MRGVYQTGFIMTTAAIPSGWSAVSPAQAEELGEGTYVLEIDDEDIVGWRKTSSSGGISLGVTSSEAFPGDKGQEALDHKSETGNPHDTVPSDIGAAKEGGDSEVTFKVKNATLNKEAVNLEQLENAIQSVSCELIDCGNFS